MSDRKRRVLYLPEHAGEALDGLAEAANATRGPHAEQLNWQDIARALVYRGASLPDPTPGGLDVEAMRVEAKRAGKGSSSFITTPPNPGKTKARADRGSSSFITTPPNPGKTKARAGKGSS